MTRRFTPLLLSLSLLLITGTASGAQIPAGIDATQLKQLEQALGSQKLKALQAGQSPAQPSPEEKRAPTSQEAAPAEPTPQETAEAAAKAEQEDKQRFTYLLQQANALARDGEVSAEDRSFLAARARDLGLDEQEAESLVDRVLEQQRRVQVYRSILAAFMEDGVLDASETRRLAAKRKELGISEAEGRDLVDEVRADRPDRALDVLSTIRKRDQALDQLAQTIDLYGRQLFQAAPDAFLPAAGLPPPENYVVGPGDQFRVTLWGRLSDEYTLPVDPEGRVQFPKIGNIRVGGLTYAEAKRLLTAKAESITGVSAAVALDQMRTIQVFVVGEVERPGSVALSPLSGAIHALMAAGGPTSLGSLRSILHRRRGKVVSTLDLYAFLQSGEAPGDQPLQSGDVVVVPRARKLVRAVGQVRRPAIYELRDDEGLRALTAYAGGLAPDADAGRIRVERARDHEARVTLDASLAPGAPDFPLHDGDTVRVYPLPEHLANKVSLFGHVYQPGTYAFRQGMRASDLVGSADNLKPEVDLAYAVILRETGPDRARAVVPFDLGKALGGEGTGDDPALQPLDEVYVFARQQFRPPLRAKVSGQIRNPGLYRIEKGARVADLVRMAGGLQPNALLTRAEVLRYLPDRNRQTLYVNLEAALAGDPAQNLPLQDEDELVVHLAWSEVQEATVLIEGEVNGYKEKALAAMAEGEATPASQAEVKRGLSAQERLEENKARASEKAADKAAHEAEATGFSLPGANAITPEKKPEPPAPALTVPLTRGMTVRDLIFKADGLTKDAYLPVAHLYRTDPATKQVTIHTFDLGRALQGDPAQNLVLQDLDHVVVHSAYDFAPVRQVSVAGRVNRPDDYPYAANMRVRDLVLAAGGLTDDAYLGQAEVVRSEIVAGEKGETRTLHFDLQAAMAGDPGANLPLEPYDRLFVKEIPDWKKTRQVKVQGEVTFPGTYYVSKGEHLSSLLRRAGGYTSDAYLRGAVFTRESARRQQQERLEELRDRLQQTLLRISSEEFQGALSPEDVAAQQQYLAAQQALLQRLGSTKATGRVVIQLLPLAELEGSQWDVALEDGDALTVPKRPQTVSVVGQVYNPTSLLWEPDNRTVEHYLQKTGGPTPDAQAKQIYVVRADGTVVSSETAGSRNWWSGGGVRELELHPGDTVLVPEKVSRVSYLKEFKDVTTVMYQIALSAGVFIAVM